MMKLERMLVRRNMTRKEHVAIKPTWGLVAPAVREFYTDLKDIPTY